MAKRVKGMAKARENPNIPIAGPAQLTEVTVCTRSNPIIGAVQENEINTKANAIKKMETEVGLADITSVFADLLKWLRTYDAEQAKQVCPLLDAFVKSKLA